MAAGKIEKKKGHFYFGGWDTAVLAEKFGTPLYVLSEDILRARCRAIREDFLDRFENTEAVYAGKASLPLALVRLIHSEGLGLDLVSAISSVAATLGNIGPGLGIVGPMDNYATVPQAGKWVLSLCMLLGRLELFTVLMLFVPGTWRK